MGLFSARDKRTIGLLDIGSGSVAGALIQIDGDTIEVLMSTRQQLVIQDTPSFDRFFSSATDAIVRILDEMQKFPTRKVSGFHIILSSPWYASDVRSFTQEFDTEHLISKKDISRLIQRGQDEFMENADQAYARYLGGTPALIEVEKLRFRLNGYETKRPEGKKATSLDASLFFSVASQTVLDAFVKKVEQNYHSARIRIHSFCLPLYQVVQQLNPRSQSFTMIDISGEMSDVYLVHQGIIEGNAAFPIGKNTIIRKIAQNLGTNEADAWSKFSLYSSDTLEPGEKSRLVEALDELSEEWATTFSETLSASLPDQPVPSTVYVVADDTVIDWFQRQIDNKLSDTLPGRPRLHATPIETARIAELCNCETDTHTDPFILIDVMYLRNTIYTL